MTAPRALVAPVAVALVAVALAACDPASPSACEAAAEVDAILALGVGVEGFDPVSDGDVVDVVRGPQGGLMVLGALEATGIVQGTALFGDADNPLVDFELLDARGVRIGGYTGAPRHFDRDADGVFTLVGETVVLDVWDFAELPSAEVTLAARLLDACGRALTDARDVTLTEG